MEAKEASSLQVFCNIPALQYSNTPGAMWILDSHTTETRLTFMPFSRDHAGPFCLMKGLIFRETVLGKAILHIPGLIDQ